MTVDTQGSLFDDARPAPRDHLFFALLPSETERSAITAIGRPLAAGAGLRAALRHGAYHLSLLDAGFFETTGPARLAALQAAGSAVRHPPFDIAFSTALSFEHGSGNYPFVLKSEAGEIDSLAAELGRRLLDGALHVGVPRDPIWHLTLLWDRRRADPIELDRPLAMRADRLSLVRTLHGQGRHEILGEWELRS